MEPDVKNLIGDALLAPKDAVMYQVSRALQRIFPELALWETQEYAFRVESFVSSGECKITAKSDFHSEYQQGYDEEKKRAYTFPYNSWAVVEWEGHEFQVVIVGIQGSYRREARSFILGQNESIVRRFFERVCLWNTEVRGEVLVFSGGCWSKDPDLFAAIQTSTLEGLVLEDDLKSVIRNDFLAFFDSEEAYDRYGIPWKRGVLFLGPPGNGKTHAIKGLINLLQKPCLYVKTFETEHGTDQDCIRAVFDKARAIAPCILVLEDLDSLLKDGNRSFFLNEMDGFASNRGIMTVATTNHPERLDPAILERPSRFDRKYTFHLPSLEPRREFLRLRNQTLEPALRLSDGDLNHIAELTDEFSYAYLKELFLSGMMAWISAPESKPLADLMSDQVKTLLEQMRTAAEEAPPVATGRPNYNAYRQRWRRQMGG